MEEEIVPSFKLKKVKYFFKNYVRFLSKRLELREKLIQIEFVVNHYNFYKPEIVLCGQNGSK